jgi:hypothetical protein
MAGFSRQEQGTRSLIQSVQAVHRTYGPFSAKLKNSPDFQLLP